MRIVTFASGSSGNCCLAELGEARFLIDAGISCRRIKQNLALCSLRPEDLSGILITHEHGDHISGLEVLSRSCAVPIFAPATVARHICLAVPALEGRLTVIPVGEEFSLGGVTVRAFPTPHDTPESVGYRLSGDGVFALATDMGHVTEEIRSGLLGADAVVIECNHDEDRLRYGPYPYPLKRRILSDRGHLSNADCAALAALLAENGTRTIVLGHLSRENNTPRLAYEAVRAALGDADVELYVAPAAEKLAVETAGRDACLR